MEQTLMDNALQLLWNNWVEMCGEVLVVDVVDDQGDKKKDDDPDPPFVHIDFPKFNQDDAVQSIAFTPYVKGTKDEHFPKQNLLFTGYIRETKRKYKDRMKKGDWVVFLFTWNHTGQSLAFVWNHKGTQKALQAKCGPPNASGYPDPNNWGHLIEAVNSFETFVECLLPHRFDLGLYSYYGPGNKFQCQRYDPAGNSEMQQYCDDYLLGPLFAPTTTSRHKFKPLDCFFKDTSALRKQVESRVYWLVLLETVPLSQDILKDILKEQDAKDTSGIGVKAVGVLVALVQTRPAGVTATLDHLYIAPRKSPQDASILAGLLKSAWRDLASDVGVSHLESVSNDPQRIPLKTYKPTYDDLFKFLSG